MKFHPSLLVALAAAGFAQVASAQTTTVIDITGATAFRAGAVNAIKSSFVASSLQYAWVGTGNFTAASAHIFVGEATSDPGNITIVRTSWNGSTEGAKACIFGTPNPVMPTTSTVSPGGTQNVNTASDTTTTADLYFSDVKFRNTVYNSFTLVPPASNNVPVTENAVGAVIFVPMKSKVAATNPNVANFGRFTNITSAQFRALYGSTNLGRARLSQFTGVTGNQPAGDDNLNVYATGRNDFSGTRTLYLLESGYGANLPVNQWKVFTSSGVVTSVQVWPTGDLTGPVAGSTDNRSLQWTNADGQIVTAGYAQPGSELAGNGGFGSSGSLVTAMRATAAAATRFQANGTVFSGGAKNLILFSVFDNTNATTAYANGNDAQPVAWNGVLVTPSIPFGDKQKVQAGDYTFWSFENFNYTAAASAAEIALYDVIRANVSQVDVDAVGAMSVGELSGVSGRSTNDGTLITKAIVFGS